jgi:hypothetical protein
MDFAIVELSRGRLWCAVVPKINCLTFSCSKGCRPAYCWKEVSWRKIEGPAVLQRCEQQLLLCTLWPNLFKSWKNSLLPRMLPWYYYCLVTVHLSFFPLLLFAHCVRLLNIYHSYTHSRISRSYTYGMYTCVDMGMRVSFSTTTTTQL